MFKSDLHVPNELVSQPKCFESWKHKFTADVVILAVMLGCTFNSIRRANEAKQVTALSLPKSKASYCISQ